MCRRIFLLLGQSAGFRPTQHYECGIPVITSKTYSLYEAAGNAEILIDPCNADELSNVIFRMVSSTELRKFLSDKGIR